MGSDIMEPNGKPTRILPNSPSERFKFSLKFGILVAQVAKLIPHKKNNRLIERRLFFVEIIKK